MDEMSNDREFVGGDPMVMQIFRRHARIFAMGGSVLFLAGLAADNRWWFFWPAIIWGFLLFIHYMYVKSLRIDEGWADQRANQVTDKAYDVSHIETLRERHTGTAPPVRRSLTSRNRDSASRSDLSKRSD